MFPHLPGNARVSRETLELHCFIGRVSVLQKRFGV